MLRGRLSRAALIGALLTTASGPLAAQMNGFRPLALGGFPVRWQLNAPSERLVLRYRVAEEDLHQPTAINCKRIRPPRTLLETSQIAPGSFRAALIAAFHRWRDVADVTFIEAAAGERADIVIGEQGEPTGFAFTNVELAEQPIGQMRPIVGASICLNPQRRWKIGYDGNLEIYDLVHTLTHEIGHAIGLDHPSGKGHLMSFRYSEERQGLSEGDRIGAITLYGPSRMQSLVSSELAATAPAATAPAGVTTIIGRSIKGASAD